MKKEDLVISSTKQGTVVALDSAGSFPELLARLRIRLQDEPAENWSGAGQVMVDLGSRDVSQIEMTALESLFFEHGLHLQRIISRPDLPLEKLKSTSAGQKGKAKAKSSRTSKTSLKTKAAAPAGTFGAEVIKIKDLPAKTKPTQLISEPAKEKTSQDGPAEPAKSSPPGINLEAAATKELEKTVEISAEKPTAANQNQAPTETKGVAGRAAEQSDTLLVQRSLRSGQCIQHTGSVVIMGDVNPGAEVTAGGNIVVMGSFRGVAHAGASGDESATITAFRLRPTQLRIAGHITRPPDGEQGGPEVTETARIREGIVVIERY